jgi:hypothetical protein
VEIRVGVRRQLFQPAGLDRVEKQIRQPAFQRRKHDSLAVWRPARVVNLPELIERNFSSFLGLRDIHNHQHGSTAAESGHGEAAARGVPRTGRMDVLQTVEMRVGGGAHHLANDGSRLAVRKEQIQ